MNDVEIVELKDALTTVIAYLDAQMEETPSRQLADVSNYLENVKAGL